MVEMVEPTAKDVICDPASGTCGFLVAAGEYLRERRTELFADAKSRDHFHNHMFHGYDFDTTMLRIGSMNMLLHGVENPEITYRDSLSQDYAVEEEKYSLILANPPYSIKQWDREAWSSDKWGRNSLGTPPQGRADYAFQQHILTSLTAKGRSAVLWPHGVLFRNEEQAMRAKMVEQDWVEAVIGLGPNLFYNSPMESCIVICNRKKVAARKGKVIFIDAVNEVTRERAQSFLTPAHQQRILAAYKAFADVPGFTKVATLAEISAVSAAQSGDIAQVNGAVEQLDHMTQQLTAWQATNLHMLPFGQQLARQTLIAHIQRITDVREVVTELAKSQGGVEHCNAPNHGHRPTQ